MTNDSQRRYGVVIQARANASRLKGKMTLPFHQGNTILEILMQRLINAIDHLPVILATTQAAQDDPLANAAAKAGLQIYRGDEQNVLKRMIEAGQMAQLTHVVRVCADNPFLDTGQIVQMIAQHQQTDADYLSVEVAEGKPAILSHFGFFAELASMDALLKTLHTTHETYYLEHVTNYIYTHPDQFKVAFMKAPAYLYGRNDIRLTVDTMSDFEIAASLYQKWDDNHWDIQDLVTYIDQNPEIKAGMKKMITQNEK